MRTDITICLNSKVDGKQPSLQNRIYSVDGLAPALTCGFHYLIAICGGGSITTEDMLCPTLTTHADRICRFEGMKGKRLRVRRLTERESFRLMGVRDSDISKIQETQFIAVSKNGKEKLSHITSTQQYAIAGNSIVVDVLDAIFEQMFYPVREEGQLF